MLHDIAAQVITDRIGVPARPARKCRIPPGAPSPACSAVVQQFFRGRSASSPSTNARARRRGSTRGKRPATQGADARLRHTLATQATNRGMRLEAIAALFGHRKMEMTLIYAKIANRAVRAAVDRMVGTAAR
jgi:integrase-like protein